MWRSHRTVFKLRPGFSDAAARSASLNFSASPLGFLRFDVLRLCYVSSDMGSTTHIVPIDDFDLAWHERAIHHAGRNRFEADGQVFPSDEDHAADKKRIAEIKRKLAKLAAAQRRSSRWPTKTELKKALEQVSKSSGAELWFGPYRGPWQQGSVSTYNEDRSMITSSLTVNTCNDGTYYCEADADMLHVFARAVARVAGPQITFLAEDYSPADYTALILSDLPATKTKTKAKTTTTVNTKTKTKTRTKTKAKTKSRTR
jgi:hypothetical protein